MNAPDRPTKTWVVGVLALLLAAAAVMLGAPAASAHEGEESQEASQLVRQAIAIMANDPGNVEAATDKLSDAAAATDQDGVDPALLSQASQALAEGDLHRARALAEQSIGAQPHLGQSDPLRIGETTPSTPSPASTDASGAPTQDPGASTGVPATMPMATGAEPGRLSFADPLIVPSGLTSGDWTVLALSIAALLLGGYLTFRFRPTRHEARR